MGDQMRMMMECAVQVEEEADLKFKGIGFSFSIFYPIIPAAIIYLLYNTCCMLCPIFNSIRNLDSSQPKQVQFTLNLILFTRILSL